MSAAGHPFFSSLLGDSRILTAAALFVLVVLLRACETPPD
jgi:hypothetical protein